MRDNTDYLISAIASYMHSCSFYLLIPIYGTIYTTVIILFTHAAGIVLNGNPHIYIYGVTLSTGFEPARVDPHYFCGSYLVCIWP